MGSSSKHGQLLMREVPQACSHPKPKPEVEDEWDTRVNTESGDIGEYALPEPKPQPKPFVNKRMSQYGPRYKNTVKQRAREYYAGAQREKTGTQLKTIQEPGQRDPVYKTQPRWSKRMLSERRAEFWENVCEGDGMSKNTDVWMLIKWHLEKKSESRCLNKGADIEGIKGLVTRGGLYKANDVTGSTILHYRFVDQEGERYEVPCYVVIDPKNLL